MWVLGTQLIFMIVVILIAAQLFSNALEYFGEEIGISNGVAGSIFAAISTALPETMIPLIAILSGTSNKLVNEEISVGAILGAPLMLSTLSTFIMTISILRKRGIKGRMFPEKTGLVRDLNFFLLAFVVAAIAMYIPLEPRHLRVGLSILLVMIYLIYLVLTIRVSKKLVEDGHGVVTSEPLIFARVGFKNNLVTILLQLILGLGLLLMGARGFINSIYAVSKVLPVSALLLSLLIIPIATELPEKVNSVLWARKNKDTLAIGNITGAMVFQGTLLPALGILLTPWQPNKVVLMGIIATLIAATWLRVNTSAKGIPMVALLGNGALYFIYLSLILNRYY